MSSRPAAIEYAAPDGLVSARLGLYVCGPTDVSSAWASSCRASNLHAESREHNARDVTRTDDGWTECVRGETCARGDRLSICLSVMAVCHVRVSSPRGKHDGPGRRHATLQLRADGGVQRWLVRVVDYHLFGLPPRLHGEPAENNNAIDHQNQPQTRRDEQPLQTHTHKHTQTKKRFTRIRRLLLRPHTKTTPAKNQQQQGTQHLLPTTPHNRCSSHTTFIPTAIPNQHARW